MLTEAVALFKRLSRVVALVSVVALAWVYWVIGGQFVAPRRHKIPAPPPKMHAQAVTLDSASGARLGAWLMVPEEPRAAVVLLHGIHADRTATLARARLFWNAGYVVLSPDLQGHGTSTGDMITLGYRESRDAISAIAYMRERFPSLPVGAVGVSLGGASLALAGNNLHADAVVTESAFSDIEHATYNRLALRAGRAADILTPLLLLQLRPRFGISAKDLHPIAHIGDLGCPVLVISGSDDPYTPADETRRLFAAAHEPKALWIVPNAGHIDLFRKDPEGYRSHVLGFLDRHLGKVADATTS
jgi:dipeptidyl aminopeptidase/acylaminoacyl peptidase